MDFMNKLWQSKELKWLKIAKSVPFPSNKHVSSDIDHRYIQGGYFHCCCDWLLDSFLFGSKIKGRSEKTCMYQGQVSGSWIQAWGKHHGYICSSTRSWMIFHGPVLHWKYRRDLQIKLCKFCSVQCELNHTVKMILVDLCDKNILLVELSKSNKLCCGWSIQHANTAINTV